MENFNIRNKKKCIKLGTFFLVIFVLIIWPNVKYFSLHAARALRFLKLDDFSALLNYDKGVYNVLLFIRQKTPKDSLFLVFRQSDFAAYAKRKYVSDLDPRLVEFYKLDDKDKAYGFVLKLGIDYIYLPNYMTPTYYNSQIYRIVADPQICRLVCEEGGYRLFKLLKNKRKTTTAALNVSNAAFSLSKRNGNTPSGWTLYTNKEKLKANSWRLSEDERGQPVLNVWSDSRNGVFLYPGRGPINLLPGNCFSYEKVLEPGTTYHFSASIRGKGLLYVYLLEYSKDGLKCTRIPLWSSPLCDRYREIENTFSTSSQAHEYRIVFTLKGKGEMSLRDFAIEKICFASDLERETKSAKPEETWIPLFTSDLEDVEPDKPESFGWWTYSESQPVSWPWGLTTDSHSGKYGVYMKRLDSGDCWLYTGHVYDKRNPGYSFYDRLINLALYGKERSIKRLVAVYCLKIISAFDDKHKVLEGKKDLYRVSASVKGKGYAELYIRWFDEQGRGISRYLDLFFLPGTYQGFVKEFDLPQVAKDIMIAFRLKKMDTELSAIYVDDLVVEKKSSYIKG